MTAGGRYAGWLLVLAAIGLGVVLSVGPRIQREVAWGIGVALVVQAPLGWWTVKCIGTDRFQLVWVLGMVIRLALVAVAGLILVPELRWEPVATLGALVGTMLLLLLVEVLAILGKNSEIKAR